MTKRHLVIATRESPLAIKQTESIRDALLMIHPHLTIDLLGITTQADQRLDVTLTDIGGKGLFVKELEEALFDGRADIAVHSMKDVPMALPPGLILPVITKREDPRDAFIAPEADNFLALPPHARVGTASLRRQTQLLAIRNDVEMLALRGNIHTRLKKLDQGEFDAIILASAGLIRMGLGSRIRSYLSIEDSLPAAGQGALGIECRLDDQEVLRLIQPLNDPTTADCVTAERAVCRHLGGGCKVPVAAYATIKKDNLTIRGLVANRNGSRILCAERSGERAHANALGLRVAEELLQQGAGKILKEFE